MMLGLPQASGSKGKDCQFVAGGNCSVTVRNVRNKEGKKLK